MGHDIHFLERSVERLGAPEAETALRLYKDPELLRFILEHAAIPDGAGQVALSQADMWRSVSNFGSVSWPTLTTS